MTGQKEIYSQKNPETSRKSARNLFYLPLAFAVVFFGVLFLLNFPKPGLDDLFFVGVPLNLAQGGTYSNPLLDRQEFPSDLYFVHPPTYSYALAGWLRLFGVNSLSMLGFQWFMYLLICGATLALLRRRTASAPEYPRGKTLYLLAWLVPLAVTAAFLPEGLRPEAFSVALTMCGFALMQCCGRTTAAIFFGFVLMFFGGSSAERVTLFSAALAIAAILNLRKEGVPLFQLVMLSASALVLVCGVLLFLIQFKLGEFWNTFRFTATGRLGDGVFASIAGFFRYLSILHWPIVLLWLASLPFIPALCDRKIARTNFLLLGAFVLAIAIGPSGHGAIWYVILMLLFVAMGGPKPLARIPGIFLPLLIAGALLIANSRNLIYAGGILSGRIKADTGARLEEARALRSTPEQAVLIDSQTARYVFDYRFPTNFLDWSFSARFPGSLATDDPLRPGDIYLLGPDSVEWLNRKTQLNLELPRWRPLGRYKSFHEYPRRVYIIRPQECGDRRSPPP